MNETAIRMEEQIISVFRGMGCVFRIVEHTNYHLSGGLTDTGYALRMCGIVSELCLADSESSLNQAKKGRSGLFQRKGAGEGNMEYFMTENDTFIGIKRQELSFLPDGNLPEKYKRAGFNRDYLYRCYQKEDTRNGFTE